MAAQQQPDFDPLVDQAPSRYVVGIDLGTTNCAVTYVDTRAKSWQVKIFPVPQLVAPGLVEARETLPSFHYEPIHDQSVAEALRLPWTRARTSGKNKKQRSSERAPSADSAQPLHYAVGFMARDEGTATPGRLIASAKSWLCHTGVDRTADLLPWHGAADVERLSPVEVSSRYLAHIRDAWNHQFSSQPLADQDIVITLPASFDEVARELTVAAAAMAGLKRVVLIEEPQAAFYAWLYKHDLDWQRHVQPGQNILVCDIGGGTSDFTLIRVRRGEASAGAGGQVQFHRVAVGNHLILGGDNLDLALAQRLERQLKGDGKLEPRQWSVLVRTCRQVKEELLGEGAPEKLTVSLPGGGTKVIGGALRTEARRDDVLRLLVDGFLPPAKLTDRPVQRQSGFQEFGLPYAPDPAITRYLAEFLTTHRDVAAHDAAAGEEPVEHSDAARPDIVLLNGGFFASPVLRERLLEVLTSWFRSPGDETWSPMVLDHDRLDLAVARGAAYYGMVRRGEGVRINANLARSYYIHMESDPPSAVCLLPATAEPGQDIELSDRTFELLVSQPVEFPLYVSSTRLTDAPGEIVPIDVEQMSPLPPIRTVLQTGRRRQAETIPVHLHSRLTEIGTLDLWCGEAAKEQRWRLQFDIRSTTQTDVAAHEAVGESAGVIDEATWQTCHGVIDRVFADDGEARPQELMKRLTEVLEMSRDQWPPSLLRRIWDTLMQLEPGRRKSPVHEARWLNLLGFALRPGYGVAVDDWRVAQTWRMVSGKLAHHTGSSRNESLILWRRIAGGLSRGQQMAIAEPLLALIRGLSGKAKGRQRGAANLRAQDSVEAWRLLGSLELLGVNLKLELGDMLVELLARKKWSGAYEAMAWTLGRLGQRVPLYGPLNTVVPRDRAEVWLKAILGWDRAEPIYHFAVMQLARRTDDRYRDLNSSSRDAAARWLEEVHAEPHLRDLVEHGGQLDSEEQGQVFGESLPKGLRLASRRR